MIVTTQPYVELLEPNKAHYIIPSTTKDSLLKALAIGQYPTDVDKLFRNECMWFRFNYLADSLDKLSRTEDGLKDGLGVSQKNDQCWAIVNRLLNLPISQYDFNAFNPIHSMGEYKHAMELCTSTSVDGPWKKRTCSKCGREYVMEYHSVMELQLRNANVPSVCSKHGGSEYLKRIMMRNTIFTYNDFKPTTVPLSTETSSKDKVS